MRPERFDSKPYLSQNEQAVFNIIAKAKMVLSDLKIQPGLRNKEWDNGTKDLENLYLPK